LEPGTEFYHRLGIEARNEWRPYGVTGEVLSRLAAHDVGDDE
jgi:hypothetical protein